MPNKVFCRDCNAPCVWLKTRNGKNILVDANSYHSDDGEVFNRAVHSCHWDNCPKAEERKKEYGAK